MAAAGDTGGQLKVKPPLPPATDASKRPLSPPAGRRQLSSPTWSQLVQDFYRARSPPAHQVPFISSKPAPRHQQEVTRNATSPAILLHHASAPASRTNKLPNDASERPQSPTPESEVAQILKCDLPPKRNSIINLPGGQFVRQSEASTVADDTEDNEDDRSRTFRPISPSPITGTVASDKRPMSPTSNQPARPFSPIPEWLDRESTPTPSTSLEDLTASLSEMATSSNEPTKPTPPDLLIVPNSLTPKRPGIGPRPTSTSDARSGPSPTSVVMRGARPKSCQLTPQPRRLRPSSAPVGGASNPRAISPVAAVMSALGGQPRDTRFARYKCYDSGAETAQPLRLQTKNKPARQPQEGKFEPRFQVPDWTVDQVLTWIKKVGFQEYAPAFHESGVDGDILLMLTEQNIREDIGIRNGILRKRFLRELKNLKKTADYTGCDGGVTANFLAQISPEYRAYTYNLISNDLSVDYMQRLDSVSLEDMLKYAGVESSIHRRKIIEALFCCDEDSVADSLYSEPLHGADVYVSYPRVGGAELASLIAMQLKMRGFSVLAEAHDGSLVNENHLEHLRESRHYVLVMPPGVLDGCILADGGHSPDDLRCRLHAEIVCALEADLNIIPVMADCQWPDPAHLPDNIRPLASFNGVRWVHDYQDACLGKLEKFIRQGDPFLAARSESPFSLMRSGRSTPHSEHHYNGQSYHNLSPYVNRAYKGMGQRTASIDSAIGSS